MQLTLEKVEEIAEQFGVEVFGKLKLLGHCRYKIKDLEVIFDELASAIYGMQRYFNQLGAQIVRISIIHRDIDTNWPLSLQLEELAKDIRGKDKVTFNMDLFSERIFPNKIKEAYHITPKKYAKRILEEGLSPRVPSGSPIIDPELGQAAIYLITDITQTAHLARSLEADHFRDNPENDWALLGISGLENHDLFFDCEYNYSWTVWTKDPIPPEKIRVLDYF